MYVGLPDQVSDADYGALQLRTVKRKQREQVMGPYEARRRTPPVAGEFGEWLRTAWWESVESGLPAHHKRGVDVAVAFFSEDAASTTNRVKVADYFWRESGKWAQKNPPEGFGSLKFYGRWGRRNARLQPGGVGRASGRAGRARTAAGAPSSDVVEAAASAMAECASCPRAWE